MKPPYFIYFLALVFSVVYSTHVLSEKISLTNKISVQEFSQYKDVADFIDHSPKVTILVKPEASDIKHYGEGVKKTLTGSDCDRDGKMDDNATCNKVFLKLWLKYKR